MSPLGWIVVVVGFGVGFFGGIRIALDALMESTLTIKSNPLTSSFLIGFYALVGVIVVGVCIVFVGGVVASCWGMP